MRYSEHPILIQGPGAGPKVTAAGLMTDLVAAAERVAAGTGVGVGAGATTVSRRKQSVPVAVRAGRYVATVSTGRAWPSHMRRYGLLVETVASWATNTSVTIIGKHFAQTRAWKNRQTSSCRRAHCRTRL